MKKLVFTLALIATSFYCHAIDGHNGIKFSMTQQQVEQLGFICNTSDSSDKSYLATCKHMDMTGAAFSVPTRNFEVTIGKDKRVSSIEANLVGVRSLVDYLELKRRISEFFPKKDEAGTFSHQGAGVMRDAWRANNNAGISLFYSSGVKGIINDTLSVTHGTTLSPRSPRLQYPFSGNVPGHGKQRMILGSSFDRVRLDSSGPDRQHHQTDSAQ